MTVITKGELQFTKDVAVIESAIVGRNENGRFVVLALSNDVSFRASLDQVRRGVSRNIGWEHVPELVDATITYFEIERVKGQPFKFLPNDTEEIIAENDGKIQTVWSIRPSEDVRELFRTQPLYESVKTELVEKEREKEREKGGEFDKPQIGDDEPEDTTAEETAAKGAKGSKKG